MFNLGGMEILVILVVALLVLGPDKLPKFMRTVGKAVGELRRASTEFQRTMNTEIAAETSSTDEASEPEPENTAAEAPPRVSDSTAVAEALPDAPLTPAAKKRSVPRAARPHRARPHADDGSGRA